MMEMFGICVETWEVVLGEVGMEVFLEEAISLSRGEVGVGEGRFCRGRMGTKVRSWSKFGRWG